MKKLTALAMLAAVLAFTGCVPVIYSKTVTVHKDASGNITGTDVQERIEERHSEPKKIQETGSTSFEYLK